MQRVKYLDYKDDITALDASADGASTGYTLLVSDDATGKVERVLQLL
jgi:hypothetical protein